LAELISAVPSVVCVGQAALDDVRNWLSLGLQPAKCDENRWSLAE
jgi:hypothetical protein